MIEGIMNYNQAQLMTEVSLAMTKKTMDIAEVQAAGLIEMLNTPVQAPPTRGLDIRV